MVGWHHQLRRHEFEHTQGDSEGQGSLACCSPLGHKDSDMTERLNNNIHNNSTITDKLWDVRENINLWNKIMMPERNTKQIKKFTEVQKRWGEKSFQNSVEILEDKDEEVS